MTNLAQCAAGEPMTTPMTRDEIAEYRLTG